VPANGRGRPRGPVNWTSVRERLAAAQHRLDAIDQPVEGEFYERLKAGTVGLGPSTAAEATPEPNSLVVFRIGNERYAVDAIDVLEVVALTRVTALPGLPALYRGLITHRGIVFPLVDIRWLFGGAAVETASPEQAILFFSETYALAVAADEVETFVRVAAADIAATGDGERAGAAAIRGVTADGVIVLDVSALLADARLVVDERSSRA
jgi:chemotaxis signal transduction protein